MTNLFKDASLVITPNASKAGKLYAIKPTSGAGDLNVVRNTTATRVNSAGLIEVVPANVPRLDYTNGSCPSILVEPQRTNLVFPSDILTTQTRTVTAISHTLSFYGTGSVTLSGVATGTLVGTGVNNRVTLTFTPTAGSLTLTVSGTVTLAQLEAGSNATSYIPTVASAVTRNADVISKTGISDLIGQTEGTLFVDYLFNENFSNNSSSDNILLALNDGTNSNFFIIIHYGNSINTFSRKIRFVARTLWVNQAIIDSVAQNTGTYKVAVKYKLNEFKLFVNGVLIGTDTSGTIPATSRIIFFDFITNVGTLQNYINSVALWKTALTEQECVNLTTL